MQTAGTHSRVSKPAFGSWLLMQSSRKDAIGDLARAASQDPGFPRDGSADAVSCRLNAVGADAELHFVVEEAELDWAAI